MKHTFLAVAFAVAILSGCHKQQTQTTVVDQKVVKCPAKKSCPKKAAAPKATPTPAAKPAA